MTFTDLHDATLDRVVEEGLAAVDRELFVVNPGRETVRTVVRTLWTTPETPTVKLFAEESTLKTVLGDFLIASRLADLVSDERLAVRTLDEVPRSSLFLAPELLVSLVDGGDSVAALSSTDEGFVSGTHEEYTRRWERSAPYSLRTPPLSRVRETMSEDISAEAVEDFDTALDALETARGDGEGLDEVTVALLVAANNRELLYDISRWGEDIRLASKATFSRTKNQLESIGLLDTEKVPIEMGRPRLRLVLGERDLVDSEIETVVERAKATLS
ncbi:hypothetical protein SAMN05216226_10353 [Halovenus aranensis]|jgi:hypothetical protein|uniref:Transcriptional regulator n=1 Tax=Halovenus aranensis TaxID=890420 RepID=A0A1G8TGB0_9EURY|nr:DUF5821 family protein [Halovenus aranensis]SDJ40548.1 hypothetical protein SAMN05216226_10353 [Halovenus aranensis]